MITYDGNTTVTMKHLKKDETARCTSQIRAVVTGKALYVCNEEWQSEKERRKQTTKSHTTAAGHAAPGAVTVPDAKPDPRKSKSGTQSLQSKRKGQTSRRSSKEASAARLQVMESV